MTDIGHNSSFTEFARGQLKSIIEGVERLEEEKKNVNDDINALYSEAQANGYDKKILKKIVALRKKTQAERDEEQAILDLYMHALGMTPMEEFIANQDEAPVSTEAQPDPNAEHNKVPAELDNEMPAAPQPVEDTSQAEAAQDPVTG